MLEVKIIWGSHDLDFGCTSGRLELWEDGKPATHLADHGIVCIGDDDFRGLISWGKKVYGRKADKITIIGWDDYMDYEKKKIAKYIAAEKREQGTGSLLRPGVPYTIFRQLLESGKLA